MISPGCPSSCASAGCQTLGGFCGALCWHTLVSVPKSSVSSSRPWPRGEPVLTGRWCLLLPLCPPLPCPRPGGHRAGTAPVAPQPLHSLSSQRCHEIPSNPSQELRAEGLSTVFCCLLNEEFPIRACREVLRPQRSSLSLPSAKACGTRGMSPAL